MILANSPTVSFRSPGSKEESLPVGIQFLSFSTDLAASKWRRIEESKGILGQNYNEEFFLKQFGEYILEDALAHEVRLAGLSLPANGECVYSAPKNWKPKGSALVWSVPEIRKYLNSQNAKIRELYVPKWAESACRRLQVPEENWLEFFALTLAHVEPELCVSVEK